MAATATEEPADAETPSGSVALAKIVNHPTDNCEADDPSAQTKAADAAATSSRPETLLDGIARLKREQKILKKEKQVIQKALRNAEKRRKRIKDKAKLLTDADLAQVIAMRAAGPAAGP